MCLQTATPNIVLSCEAAKVSAKYENRDARHEYRVDDGVALLLVMRLSCAQRNATSVGGRCLLNACVSVNVRYLIDSVSAICSVKRLSHACRVQLQVKLRTAH